MRRISRLTVTVLIGAVLTACGSGATSHSHGGDTTDIALSDAKVLDNPKAFEGNTHAGIGKAAFNPIADSPQSKLPVTLTDSQGTKVTVKDTSRILALDIYGTLSQTVFELGLGDQVVGRDSSTQFDEAEELPMVTSKGHELNAETILSLDPTVILTDTSLGPWDVILQMRDAGIPVVVVDSARSLDNIRSLTNQVATALGVPSEGKKLADRITQEIDDVRAQIKAIAPQNLTDRLRMVFLYVRGQSGIYYMFGEGSGAQGLIEALDGYDVAKEINWNGMKPVNDEGLVAAQPDLILMMTDGLKSADGVDGLLEKLPALAQTPAGQKKRIVDMADSQILGYGPRTAAVLNALAVAVYAPESS